MHAMAVFFWIALGVIVLGIAARFYLMTIRTTVGPTRRWCSIGTTVVLLLVGFLAPTAAAYIIGSMLGWLVGSPIALSSALAFACLVAILAIAGCAFALQLGSFKLIKWLTA